MIELEYKCVKTGETKIISGNSLTDMFWKLAEMQGTLANLYEDLRENPYQPAAPKPLDETSE